jgi:hypothetical protein
MDGPKVIGWAQQQAELLEQRVLGYIDDNNNFIAPTHPDNDEFLWNDMLQHIHQSLYTYHGGRRRLHRTTELQDGGTFPRRIHCRIQ